MSGDGAYSEIAVLERVFDVTGVVLEVDGGPKSPRPTTSTTQPCWRHWLTPERPGGYAPSADEAVVRSV